MKATLFDINGNKAGEIELPKIFGSQIREDIVQRYFEADKFIQPYATKERAGLRQAAAGKISHKRHDWKGHYGRGISRMPRKTMWRRGTQFYWIAANVPGTRGGRRAHPPKVFHKEKKINKKEIKIAFNSAYASTANLNYVKKRYNSLEKIDSIPFVIDFLPKKTKEIVKTLNNIFGENSYLVFKKKEVRAGKGKLRGRKYKTNAGALLVISSEEKTKFKGLDIKPVNEIKISDLYPLGRLTLYTKKALEELSKEEMK